MVVLDPYQGNALIPEHFGKLCGKISRMQVMGHAHRLDIQDFLHMFNGLFVKILDLD